MLSSCFPHKLSLVLSCETQVTQARPPKCKAGDLSLRVTLELELHVVGGGEAITKSRL